MARNLLETYSRQIQVAENYVANNYNGAKISENTKLATAVLLDNTNKFLTESINMTRQDLGDWKKFCLNLTNIAVPSLIANNLVIVHPMTSFSGSVAYLKYVTTTAKGDMPAGTELNSVFGLGANSEARRNYTNQVVIETITATKKVALTPDATNKFGAEGEHKDAKIISVAGVESYVDAATLAAGNLEVGCKVCYCPKEFRMYEATSEATHDIPTVGAKLTRIPLIADVRRIRVQYDQITAYQAKTDYGFSLDKQIAEQACGELQYEIDSEIVEMLRAGAAKQGNAVTWSKTLPVGVSKQDHFSGFSSILTKLKNIIYGRTKKFHPNYIVCAADVLEVIEFVKGYEAVKNPKMNGPYKAGTVGGLDVYVTPDLAEGEFFVGLNGNDMMSSAGVYAPYMAIVPTMLIQDSQGSSTQAFSTWYAKALLNEALLVAGKITD